MDLQSELKNRILKYTINPESKKNILEQLSKELITKETVYIEIDKSIENLIENLKLKYKI